MLGFSFQVKKPNVIKLYLYCNGGCSRFMPEDIKIMLPSVFNMGDKANQEFVKGEVVEEYIQMMEEMLVEDEVAAFQQSYM